MTLARARLGLTATPQQCVEIGPEQDPVGQLVRSAFRVRPDVRRLQHRQCPIPRHRTAPSLDISHEHPEDTLAQARPDDLLRAIPRALRRRFRNRAAPSDAAPPSTITFDFVRAASPLPAASAAVLPNRYRRRMALQAGNPASSRSTRVSSPFLTSAAITAGLPLNVTREPLISTLSFGASFRSCRSRYQLGPR